MTLYPEVLSTHLHHRTPLEKGWAAYADEREKNAPVHMWNCKRKIRGPIHQYARVQLLCRPGNTLSPICICAHIHISASDCISAHNQPQGERNMRRDPCSHCFLHKSSVAMLTKSYKRGEDDFSQDKLDVLDITYCHRARASPTLVRRPTLPSSNSFHPHQLRDRQLPSIPAC